MALVERSPTSGTNVLEHGVSHDDTRAVVVHSVAANERRRRNCHGSFVLWLTGLPGAGKSTIGAAAERALHELGWQTYLLDGDVLRQGLCRDLGYSEADRAENLRRAGEVARAMVDAGVVVIAAFVSPYRAGRDQIRALFDRREFAEVYIRCSVACCEARDSKGHYRLARAGRLASFTGVSDPYEEPLQAELVVDSQRESIEAGAAKVVELARRMNSHFVDGPLP